MELASDFSKLSLSSDSFLVSLLEDETLSGPDVIVENIPCLVSLGDFIAIRVSESARLPFRVRAIRSTQKSGCSIFISNSSYLLVGKSENLHVTKLENPFTVLPSAAVVSQGQGSPSKSDERALRQHGLFIDGEIMVDLNGKPDSKTILCISSSTRIHFGNSYLRDCVQNRSKVWHINCTIGQMEYSPFALRTSSFTSSSFGHVELESCLKSSNLHVIYDDCNAFRQPEYRMLCEKYAYVVVDMSLASNNPLSSKKVHRNTSSSAWDEISGYSSLISTIRYHVETIISGNSIASEIGIRPPRGILLYGPPGCSKTMIARAVAKFLGTGFLSVKGPEIFRKYVGDSEKVLKELFQKARNQPPCVIFFDEFDAVASARASGVSNVESRVIAQLLTEMDGLGTASNIFVIAATNRPDIIDPALLRPGRFDLHFYVPVPDQESRKEIIVNSLKRFNVTVESGFIDSFVSLSEGLSGASIVACCRSLAIEEIHGRPVSADTICRLLSNNNV